VSVFAPSLFFDRQSALVTDLQVFYHCPSFLGAAVFGERIHVFARQSALVADLRAFTLCDRMRQNSDGVL
jgi:hypothetical protein